MFLRTQVAELLAIVNRLIAKLDAKESEVAQLQQTGLGSKGRAFSAFKTVPGATVTSDSSKAAKAGKGSSSKGSGKGGSSNGKGKQGLNKELVQKGWTLDNRPKKQVEKEKELMQDETLDPTVCIVKQVPFESLSSTVSGIAFATPTEATLAARRVRSLEPQAGAR